MISLAEARARVLAGCRQLDPRSVALADALGCITSEPVVSPVDVPSFPNSAMDGYAVRAVDTVGAGHDRPARLRVVGTIAAGAAPATPVGPGEAVRIMTGAIMPEGADAIAIVEVTAAEGDTVSVHAPSVAGRHIRHPGEDIATGQQVFPAGTELRPGHLGVLASIGREKIAVYGRPRVGVLSTGDELAQGPAALKAGQIRDSNRPMLVALCRQSGFDAVDLGSAPDDEGRIRAAIQGGLAGCDALVTSGGVSMGDFDYVKKVLDELGSMAWMQVAIRPAKPLAFGIVAGKPVFGLPGNPVSAMVSFELFARTGLRQMMGHPPQSLDRPRITAVAGQSLARQPDGKLHLVRVVARPAADGRYHVHLSGGQESHLLKAMALADALALVPDGLGVAAGADVDVLLLG